MENFTFVLMTVLEKVLEAIYFSVFLIYGKKLENKRLLFIVLMTIEYLLLKSIIKFNVVFQLSYIFLSYIILKILYKDKTQITDIFLMMIASIILIAFCVFTYLTALFTYKNYFISLVINRILIFSFIFMNRNKINVMYKSFYKLWNRHDNPNQIKSLTIRNISVITFNFMFVFINAGMIFFIKYLK